MMKFHRVRRRSAGARAPGRLAAFSLIEAMVAGTIGIIILLGATNLAATMMRTARTAADGQALTTRAQLVRGVLQPLLTPLGDAWLVDDGRGGFATGAPGQGHCVTSTGVCTPTTGNVVMPLTLVDGGVNGSDELVALVPLAGALESVEILAKGDGTSLPNDCSSLATTQAFDVRGVTSTPWDAGALVMITKRDHVSVARVSTTFTANTTSPPATRDLELELGPAADLATDDGGRGIGSPALAAAPCSAFQSLRNARVLRVREVRVRAQGGQLQIAERDKANAAINFASAVTGIDDLQFRLEIARIPRDGDSGTASLCSCNTAAVLAGNNAFGTDCTCTSGERLNRDGTAAAVYRVTGIEVGVLVRGDVRREIAAAVPGMFNRTSTSLNDSFRRHRTTLYIGLANAHAL
jgi:hypothetical protein